MCISDRPVGETGRALLRRVARAMFQFVESVAIRRKET